MPRALLGLALTSRDKGADALPMAGFPHPALESYLAKIVQAGLRAAVCEQVEDARCAKGLVKRDVVRVVTPGTLTDDELLDPKTANYLAAVVEVGGEARPGLGRALDGPVLADRPVADRAGRRDRPAQPGRGPDLRAEPGCAVGAAAPRPAGRGDHGPPVVGLPARAGPQDALRAVRHDDPGRLRRRRPRPRRSRRPAR